MVCLYSVTHILQSPNSIVYSFIGYFIIIVGGGGGTVIGLHVLCCVFHFYTFISFRDSYFMSLLFFYGNVFTLLNAFVEVCGCAIRPKWKARERDRSRDISVSTLQEVSFSLNMTVGSFLWFS